MRIVIDPGHGGKDSGAVGRKIGIKEKDVVLGIAKHLAEKLRSAGHQVFLTRDSDVFVTLSDRVKKFEAWDADFVLSIHINSAQVTSASYVCAFVYDLQNKPLVQKAQNLVKACSSIMNGRDVGVKQANFYVLKNSKRPVCLIEVGFISNAEQEKLLVKGDVREAIAEVLYKEMKPGSKENVVDEPKKDKIEVIYEGKVLTEAKQIEDITYVPIREVFEALGFEIYWDSKTTSITIIKK